MLFRQRLPLIVDSWVALPKRPMDALMATIINHHHNDLSNIVDEIFNRLSDPNSNSDAYVVITSLRSVADKNAVADYLLAKIYAGEYSNPQDDILRPILSETIEHREALAIYYAQNAIKLSHNEARRFLLTAFMTSSYGCIHASENGYNELYKMAKQTNDLPALFDFCCHQLMLSPRYPHEALPTDDILIDLPQNEEEAINIRNIILRGNDVDFLYNTIDVFYIYFNDSRQSTTVASLRLVDDLEKEFNQHHSPWLGLFLVCLYTPDEILRPYLSMLPLPKCFTQFKTGIHSDFNKARDYLGHIRNGGDAFNDCAKVANLFAHELKSIPMQIDTYSLKLSR